VTYPSPDGPSPQPGGSGAVGPEPGARKGRGRSSGGGRHHAGRRSRKAAGTGQPAKASQIVQTGEVAAAGQVAAGQVGAAGQVVMGQVGATGQVAMGQVGAAGQVAMGQVGATARVAAARQLAAPGEVAAAGLVAGAATEPPRPDGRAEHNARQAAPIRFAQLPYVAVLIGIAVALAIVGQGVQMVRSGTLVFAGVLLVAALARLVLPERRAGMLSSRRRLLDVTIFGVLGIGLLVGALVVPVPG